MTTYRRLLIWCLTGWLEDAARYERWGQEDRRDRALAEADAIKALLG